MQLFVTLFSFYVLLLLTNVTLNFHLYFFPLNMVFFKVFDAFLSGEICPPWILCHKNVNQPTNLLNFIIQLIVTSFLISLNIRLGFQCYESVYELFAFVSEQTCLDFLTLSLCIIVKY